MSMYIHYTNLTIIITKTEEKKGHKKKIRNRELHWILHTNGSS